MLRKLRYDCHGATLLSVKADEGAATWLDRWKLKYHLKHCSPCRRFIEQSRLFTSLMSSLAGHYYSEVRLSEESKKRIEQALESARGSQ